MRGRVKKLDEIIGKMERIILVILLCAMIAIAFLQILLRNLFFTGLDWGDALVRNLVLWVGLIGATLATKQERHITIDLISRWLPSRGKKMAAAVTNLFSCLVCLALCYAAAKFVINEYQMANKTLLDIPAWIPQVIIPLAFMLMAWRFAWRTLVPDQRLGK